MGKFSDRDRPVCEEIDCTVEICEGDRYCEAHVWTISRWLIKSRQLLIRVQAQELAKLAKLREAGVRG